MPKFDVTDNETHTRISTSLSNENLNKKKNFTCIIKFHV